MNRDYQLTANAHGFTIDKIKGDDLAKFPIEYARFRSSWYLIALAIITITGYGWALAIKVVYLALVFLYELQLTKAKHVAVPLALQFLIGGSITGVFNMCGTLLTDLHPMKPATAQASSNVVRCALSASGLAVLELMITHIGVGWTFTIFAGICLATAPMILAEVQWGLRWRQARIEESEESCAEHLEMASVARLQDAREVKAEESLYQESGSNVRKI